MNDFLDNLLVILVIYNTEIPESPAFQTLSVALSSQRRKGDIFIYDNSPAPKVIPVRSEWNIFYNHDPTNPGVSKAYNEGFKKAKELNKKWLMLADQDTLFPINIFAEYGISLGKFNSSIVVPILKDETGNVSPFKFYFGGGQRRNNLNGDTELILEKYFFHNSGLIVSTENFEQAGLYDENLSLDFSDMSFAIKLRENNLTFSLANIVCKHSLATAVQDSLTERLKRFESYVASGFYFQKNYFPSHLLLIRIFLRSIKLSWNYKNIKFLMLFFEK